MPGNVDVRTARGGAVPVASAQMGTKFVYNAARPLDGIIAYLARESDGNVHKQRGVNVTASSCNDCCLPPENAVESSQTWGLSPRTRRTRGSATTSTR